MAWILTTDAANEINNDLTTVLMHLDMLKKVMTTGIDQKASMNSIEKIEKTIFRISENLSALSSIQDDKPN